MPNILNVCRKGHQDWYFRKTGEKRCRICDRNNARNVYLRHRDVYVYKARMKALHLRMEVLIAYGAECACCREHRYEFLSLEHKNGNGAQHRREIGQGYAVYHWAKKNDYPDSLEVLCMNCNFSKGQYGYCPHNGVDCYP